MLAVSNLTGFGGAGGGAKSLIAILQSLGLSSGLALSLDAGDAASYAGGSAQQWSDLSGNGINYNRGSTSGSEGSDPTFVGSAGALDESAYFSFNGSQFFTPAVSPTTFDDAWAKTNGKVTLALVTYFASNTGARGLCGNTTAFNPASNGGDMLSTAGGTPCKLRYTTATLIGANTMTAAVGFSSAAIQFAAVAFDQAAGTCLLQTNSTQDLTTGLTGSDSSSPPQDFQIANTGSGSNEIDNGDRIYAFAAWSGVALSALQLSQLYTTLKSNRFVSLP